MIPKHAVGGSEPAGPYSPGVIAEGRFVYVSGQGPTRDGVVTGESVGEQTRTALQNLEAVLAGAGASLADVVRCGVFLADLADFDEMNRVYADTFPPPLPARTTVGVALPGILVEIDCVAVLPASTAQGRASAAEGRAAEGPAPDGPAAGGPAAAGPLADGPTL
jgi:2-iminobutanoate/2-iminopropanoate deaminase